MAKDAPIVGIVVTISPSFNLYKIVVLPAASRPTIKIRISFLPHSLSKSFETVRPMLAGTCGEDGEFAGWDVHFAGSVDLRRTSLANEIDREVAVMCEEVNVNKSGRWYSAMSCSACNNSVRKRLLISY